MTLINVQVQSIIPLDDGVTNTRKLGIWRGVRLEYDVESCPAWGNLTLIHVNSMTEWWSERRLFEDAPAKKKGRKRRG